RGVGRRARARAGRRGGRRSRRGVVVMTAEDPVTTTSNDAAGSPGAALAVAPSQPVVEPAPSGSLSIDWTAMIPGTPGQVVLDVAKLVVLAFVASNAWAI